MAAPSLSSEQVVARGLWLLRAALAATLALTLALVWWAPVGLYLLPVVLLASSAVVLLWRQPSASLVALLFGSVAIVSPTEGLGLAEILYGAALLLFLAQWYVHRVLLVRRPLVRTGTDAAVALFLAYACTLGVVLGVLHGAELSRIRSELTALLVLFLYFPTKEFCRNHRWGPALVAAVVVWVALFVFGRNMLYIREIFLSATESWQIRDVRTGVGELLLMAGLYVVVALVVTARRPAYGLWLLAPVAVLLAGLIITKARGYWVAFAFGAGGLFFMLRHGERVRLLALGVAGGGLLVAGLLLFFSDLVTLFAAGVVNRLGTLSTALTSDISLLNRFVETAAVWERIQASPVVGNGMGAPFTYFDIIAQRTITKAFVHNGFVSMWYRYGLVGMALVVFILLSTLWHAFRSSRSRDLAPFYRALALAPAAFVLAELVVINTSNPFHNLDTMLGVTLMLSLGNGLSQRRSPPLQADAPPRPPSAPAQP